MQGGFSTTKHQREQSPANLRAQHPLWQLERGALVAGDSHGEPGNMEMTEDFDFFGGWCPCIDKTEYGGKSKPVLCDFLTMYHINQEI